MRGVVAAAAAALAALALAAAPANAHGASRGLHLHVAPDPARPGQPVAMTVDCEVAMTRVTAALHGAAPVRATLDPPARRIVVALAVPESAEPGQALSFHATAEAGDGATYRASGILRIADAAPADPPPGPVPPRDTGPAGAVAQFATGSRSNPRAAPLPSAATTQPSVGLWPKP